MRKNVSLGLGLLLVGGTVWAQKYLITTVAGNGTFPPPGGPSTNYSGDGGPATNAALSYPTSVAIDSAGNLYIADNGNRRIRMVTPGGTISTVAGNGHLPQGYSGDGGPATSATLANPVGVAVGSAGNFFIADSGNQRVRMVTPGGTISTVAGDGLQGDAGDGGPATSAELLYPLGVAVDSAGNLFIADTSNHRIRMVTPGGTISTVAGSSNGGYAGDGGPATSAELHCPAGVAVDSAGDLFIADTYNSRIRMVTPGGTISTVAGNGAFGYSGDGGPATSAELNLPNGVAVDSAGNLFIADMDNNRIRMVTPGGTISTVAGGGNSGLGDGGPATSATLAYPNGVAVDSTGDIYVADTDNGEIRLLVPQGTEALLSVAKTHFGNFGLGEAGATYSVVVGNAALAAATNGTVTVTETVPTGLTLVSMAGTGWSCSSNTCTRSDALNAGSSYSSITVTVNVATDAPSQVTNQVSVSGGGSVTASASDVATIVAPPAAPVLSSPANGATGVVVAPTLAWNASSEAASYNVYFGTTSVPPLVTSTTGISYAPGTLAASVTYYWMIAAVNSAGSANSATRSFTTGAPATGLHFLPVTPCRVADTRNAVGPFGGPTMTADSTRSFAIPQSVCGIPATALAYSLNVTVVPEGPLSYLSLWPAGQTQPLVSTLNSYGGSVVANAAIVPAGTGGAVSVYVTNPTDVILDIDGYFDTSTGATSYSFYPATPCRVADTRNATGQFGGPTMQANQSRDFPIPLSPCDIPATARAYSLNVTVVPESFLGYLATWPTGQTQPNVSTLNSYTGNVVANAALVPAGTNESISVFVTNPTDVILDINGYFSQPGSPNALSFYPVTPCRVVDTRNAAGPFGGPEMAAGTTRSFTIPASACNIPTTATAYSLNVTVVPDGALYYLSVWPTGVAQPQVSTLNSYDGSVLANAAIVPAGTDGAIDVYVTGQTHVILDINGYFAP